MINIDLLPDIIKENIKNQTVLSKGYIHFLSNNQIEHVNDILSASELWKDGIPFAYTAFGDILAWEDGYVVLYNLTEEDYNVILSGTDFLINNFEDLEYQKDYFDMNLFEQAVEKMGELEINECYTLEPIPRIGGAREIKYVSKGLLIGYLQILV